MARTKSEKIPIAKPVPIKPVKLKIATIVPREKAPLTRRFERMAPSLGGVMAEKKPGRHGRF